MKVVKITQNSLEIGHVRLTEPSLTLGRSPTCDFIFRVKGIKPVHFLIEWMGTGDFDPNQGMWTLLDISKTQSMAQESASAEGVVLSESDTVVGGFQFSLSEERLAETELGRRVLKEAYFDQDLEAEIVASSSRRIPALEMVDVHLASDAIVNISHYPKTSKNKKLSDDLNATIIWNAPDEHFVELDFSKQHGILVYSKGEPVQLSQGSKLKLQRGDLYQLRWSDHDYFVRMVDWIEVEKSKQEVLQDPIFKVGAIVLCILFALGFYLLNDPNIQVVEAPKPPPRIARVDVIEPQKNLPPTPKLPEEKPLEQEKSAEEKKPEPVVKHEVKKKEPDAGAKAAASKVQREKEKPPKAGLNNMAKKADVNAVGLLASMKKNKPTTISADQVINDGIVSDLATNSGPTKVVIQQSAGGIISADADKKVKNSGGLGRASSTLQGVDVENPNSKGSLALKGGSGEGLGLTLSGKLKGSLGSGDGSIENGTFSESVSGGLTKDQIRKALAEHRREIRACYEKALIVKSKIAGRIAYKWHIAPSGSVTSIQVVRSEVGLPQLEDCVGSVIKAIKFPEAPSKLPTTVIYPFVFQSGNG